MGGIVPIRRSGEELDASGRILFVNPWIGLWPCIFYLVIEYARPMAWVPALELIRLGMIAGLWGLAALLFSSTKRPFPKSAKWIMAFTALMIYQVWAATNNFFALEKLRLEFLPLVLGLVLPLSVLPNSVPAMRILLTTFFAVHIPTAIYGIQSGGFGPGSWFGDQNDLAFALNSALGVGCYLFVEAREVKRKLWIGAGLGLLVTTIVVSSSRGGLLGLVAVMVYLFVTAKQARKPILVLAVIGVIGILAFASDEWKSEIATIAEAGDPQDTGGRRLYYWGIGWKMFLDHPITGVGTENYRIRAPEYRDLSRYHESMWKRMAHSLYFTLLPEHGLVGVFIFCGMLVACLRGHRRLQRRFDREPDNETKRTAALLSAGLAAGMVAALATGTFVSVLYYPSIWVLAAMMGSMAATADADAEAEGESGAGSGA